MSSSCLAPLIGANSGPGWVAWWLAGLSGAAGGFAGAEPVGLGAGLEDVGVEGDPVHDGGAELLFQIITERDERASIAIGTNLPFSEWGTVFPDPRLVAAIVDRVTFNAHILETGTQSYRLRTSKTTSRNTNPS